MSNFVELPLAAIHPAAGQPRKHFAGIEELAESLKQAGQLTPVLVRPVDGGYELVHGERRWRAAQLAGLSTLRAEVRELSDTEAFRLSVVENLQREQLTPMEEAAAFDVLCRTGMTQAAAGALAGKTQSYVATKLRLLTLPVDVCSAIDGGKITEGHAKQLLRLSDADAQTTMTAQALKEDWTVARTKLAVDLALRPVAQPLPATPAELVLQRFKDRGCVPAHAPYPEEFLPDEYDPPVEVRMVPVADIVDPPGDEIRIDRDARVVSWYAEIFEALPPIAVFERAGEYIIADGRFRLYAAKLLGRQEIQCRVYLPRTNKLVATEAYLYAVAANARGGMAYNEDDYRHQLGLLARLGMSRDIPAGR